MFSPNRRSGTLRKQRLLELLLIPVVRQRPADAGRLRSGHVFVDGALGNRATAGDLMLAQSEGIEPQNFLQLAHGQPLLWQLGISTFQWSPLATAALRRHSNLMPITVPNYSRKTDRHQFGTLIGITSES
ncbi:MAG TPA: hypothetical protein VK657_02230 [Terriglobales bacterium]|nr:hypothetical protein [Terriglobales bacterium]